ncbi:MAG: hypothetical protein JWP22_3004 [Ramlibacter sp.]|nr:hypothetical protein [Ramlibacter sp.]
MKLISFLAGVATGVLLTQSMARARGGLATAGPSRSSASPGSSKVERRSGAAFDLATGGERDYPTHAPPKTAEELRERIRGRVDRTIANPDAIQIEVTGSRVTLRGQVRARDVVLLMAEVESTAGVESVQNELEIQGSLKEVAPAMTVDSPAVREGERKSSHMS